VDHWRSVLASGEPGEIEARLRRFDGVYRWFLFRVTPLFDNDGRVVKWFGTNGRTPPEGDVRESSAFLACLTAYVAVR
jgi:PAS domain-containing protein